MARFCGIVGFSKTEETVPGVWMENTIEKTYYGDVLRNVRRWENGENLNDNVNVSNRISIVADSFAYDNVFAMKYVHWMGSKWKISSVEVERPRLILSIGGLYNAE